MMLLEKPTKTQLDRFYGEFNTTPEALRKDAQVLMQWLEKQPHLPNVQDEEFLVHCLLRSKTSMEKAKFTLNRYFSLKTAMPDIYDNRDPTNPNLILCSKVISFVPMPKLTPEGYRVSILRILDPSMHNRVHPDDVIKLMFMSADLRLQIDDSPVDVFIYDMENYTMPVVSMMMANLRKFIIPGTRSIPMRHKFYYIINAVPSVESLLTMCKSFVRKELVKKIVVLKSKEDLLNVIPKKILPKDYGGEEPSFSDLSDSWMQTLIYYKDWFKQHENFKADNSKKLNREESKLGDLPLDGSFRKITFD